MPKAVFNDTVIAEYGDTILLEGNHYFPPESVKMQYLRLSDTSTVDSWKGMTIYYHVVVGEMECHDAAWSYPEPSKAAVSIKNYFAFTGDVEIIP